MVVDSFGWSLPWTAEDDGRPAEDDGDVGATILRDMDGFFSEVSGALTASDRGGDLSGVLEESLKVGRDDLVKDGTLSNVSSGPLRGCAMNSKTEHSRDSSKDKSSSSETVKDKIQLRRDKNRESARKYRQRRKDYTKDLSGKLATLEAERGHIRKSISQLLEEAQHLKKCAEHRGLGPKEIPSLNLGNLTT